MTHSVYSNQHSIKSELTSHLVDIVNDQFEEDATDFEDLHFKAFNADYYIVYHSAAKAWLARHELDTFDVIEEVREYEVDNFGEMNTTINPENIINMFVYIRGQEVIYDLLGDINLSDTTAAELLELLK